MKDANPGDTLLITGGDIYCYQDGYIDHVKGQFRLARNTAKKVIVDAGWTDVRGVYVYNVTGYVDDYDVPYNFPDDHTYTLSLRHIAEITEISEEFADLINSGRFIYLDGHVILNNDTYVEHIDGFPYKLTEYAKRHMSECCLDFKRIYDDPDYEYTFGELHKDDLPPIEKREADEAALRRVKELFAEEEAENSRLKNTPTVSPFGQAVIFHMKRCGVTEDDVADRSGLGVNTISNMRAGKKVKLETVLAFCVALDLEEAFREDLRKKAGVDFDMNNKAHRFYMTILNLCPKFNVFQYNQLCEDNGIKPWTKERQQTNGEKDGEMEEAVADPYRRAFNWYDGRMGENPLEAIERREGSGTGKDTVHSCERLEPLRSKLHRDRLLSGAYLSETRYPTCGSQR